MTLQFSNYEIDTTRFELRRAGRLIRLQRKPCELLVLLIKSNGQVVGRDEITQRIWGEGVHIDAEHSINTLVRKIRSALNDDAERQRYLKTVVGRGYAFVGQAVCILPTSKAEETATADEVKLPPVVAEAATEHTQSNGDGEISATDEELTSKASEPVSQPVYVLENGPDLFLAPGSNAALRGLQWRWIGVVAACALLGICLWGWSRWHEKPLGGALPADRTGGATESPNAEARAEYVQGRYFWNKRTLEGVRKSIECYHRAIALDPNYTNGYEALGEAYVILSSYGGPEPSKNLLAARENALQALRLNARSGEAHTVLAAVKVDLDWDWEGAIKEYQESLTLCPNYPTAHHWYALHLSNLGRNEEAEAQIEQAVRLDPLSLIINTDAAEIYYRAGEENRATHYLEKVAELDPYFADAHMIRGEVDEQQQNLPGAVRELRIASNLFHGAPNVVALLGHALALAGERKEALKTAHELENLSTTRYVSGVDIAIVYCGLGDSARAMKWLRSAYEHRDKGINIIAFDPLFANCRRDAHFLELLSELHLPSLRLP